MKATKRTTPYEQKYICDFLNLTLLNRTDQNSEIGQPQPKGCPLDFDQNMCWNITEAGSAAYLDCPFDICDSCNISFAGKKLFT